MLRGISPRAYAFDTSFCMLLAAGALLAGALTGCERKPQPTVGTAASYSPTTQPAVIAQRVLELTPAMKACATQPAGVATGLFIDRPEEAELRFVTYNVNFDAIFPDKDQAAAEKFQRVVKALDPDLLNLQEISTRSDKAVVELMNAIDPRPAGQTWYAYKGFRNVIVSKYPLKMTTDRTVPAGQRGLAMALVDLPDERFDIDLYVLDNHFKCCGGEENDPLRQQQADALISWIRDARTPGGEIDLPAETAIIVAGDLNTVGGPQVVDTLVTGDIMDEAVYGADFAPDWDGTGLVDAHPLHNVVGPDDYTWRNDDETWDGQHYDPGRLDYVIYTDSVLEAVHKFVLNTTLMSAEELAQARLEEFDVTLDLEGRYFDHLPVVVDFRVVGP